MLEALSPRARAAVLAAARPLAGRRDEVLVHKGDAVSDVFLVTDGALRVYAANAEGREATLYRLRAGEVCMLSLNAALTDGRYPAHVRVESETAAVLRLPGRVVRELMQRESAIQNLVLQSLTGTVRELLIELDRALLAPLRGRLSSYLMRSADCDGRVAATHEVIASHLGVTREAVSREIARLKRAKRVETGRGWIRLAR